jgi:hypothetical protein
MAMATDQELIRDLARNVVAQLAREELGSFNAATKVFFRDPHLALAPSHGSDDVLGFGVPEQIVQLLTPVALAAASAAWLFAQDMFKSAVKKPAEEITSEWFKQRLSAWIKSKEREKAEASASPGLEALTADQLGELHAQVRAVVLGLHVPEVLATQVADVLVRKLLELRRAS